MKSKAFSRLTAFKTPIKNSENKYVRYRIYSSLDWYENKIKRFAQVLNTLTSSYNRWDKSANDFAKSMVYGTLHTQLFFEKTVKEISAKKDSLKDLTLSQLKGIKTNLESVEGLRKKLQDTIDRVINEYYPYISQGRDVDYQTKLYLKNIKYYNSNKYSKIFNSELLRVEAPYNKIKNNLATI